ncbi:MAG: hypothetical protein AAFX77_17325 [Pseudomonadota bacterium]
MITRSSNKFTVLAAFGVIGLFGCGQSSSPPAAADFATNGTLTLALDSQVSRGETVDHSHIPVAVPDDAPIPSLSIQVERDWMSGLNLTLFTENYSMVPPPVGLSMTSLMQPSVDPKSGVTEGHAHLYINGAKIQRIYSDHVHLPETLFKPGLNQINVSINNHGHMYWTTNNRQILATLYVDLSAPDLIVHRFESFPSIKTVDGSVCAEPSQRQAG